MRCVRDQRRKRAGLKGTFQPGFGLAGHPPRRIDRVGAILSPRTHPTQCTLPGLPRRLPAHTREAPRASVGRPRITHHAAYPNSQSCHLPDSSGSMSKRSIERPTHPATGNTTQTEAIGPGDTGPTRTANHPHLQRIAHTHPMFRMTPALLTFQRRRILKNEQKCSTHWFGSDMTQTPIRILSDPVPSRVAPLGHNSAIEMQLLHQPRFKSIYDCFTRVIKNTRAMLINTISGERVFILD